MKNAKIILNSITFALLAQKLENNHCALITWSNFFDDSKKQHEEPNHLRGLRCGHKQNKTYTYLNI
jgi:hypothetical protein